MTNVKKVLSTCQERDAPDARSPRPSHNFATTPSSPISFTPAITRSAGPSKLAENRTSEFLTISASVFGLGLTEGQKTDLLEFLKSI
jgi:hypothetical protein